MSIRQLKDGGWIVQVDVGRKPDGTRDRRTRRAKTKREATKHEAELNMLAAANAGKSGRITLRWFVDEVWLPEKEPICTYDTLRGYKSHLNNHIIPILGDTNLDDIDHSSVQHMINMCATNKVARNARSTLRNVLQLALDKGIIRSNPAASRSFRYPRKVEAKNVHGEWLTSFSEHRRIIEESKGTLAHPLLVLGLCFGLRKGEIIGLDWEQVDFKKRCVHIVQTCVNRKGGWTIKAPKTESSVRDIPMTKYAYTLLKALAPDTMTGPVVVNRYGKRMAPDYANETMRRFVRSHDVPQVTVLSLRHSFATSAIRAGINVVSVSKWLGHQSVSTTLNRYVKPLQQDLRSDVADVMDTLYQAAA